MATITVPVVKVIDNNLIRIRIDAQALQFAAFNQSEFTWQLFLGFEANHEHVLLQVESEYLSDRHQLSLTSYIQFNSDSEGMATLSIHTQQAEDEFSINSVNLVDDTLKLTGNSLINNQPIKDQQILLRDVNTGEALSYPTEKGTLRGLFSVSIPLSDLPENADVALFIHYMVGTQKVEQRLILARSLEGQNVQTVLSSGRMALLEKKVSTMG